MKKLTAILLVLVLLLTTSATTLADDNFGSNSGSTTVKIAVDSTAAGNLSATVPLGITISVNADGSIIAPTEYKITNTGAISVKVTHVMAVAATGFSFTKDEFNAAKQMNLSIKPGEDGTAINLADYTSKTEVPVGSASRWNVASGSNLSLIFSGSVYQVGDITAAPEAFTVTYTIAAGTAS